MKPPSDLEFAREFHRFQTKDKAKAFSLMEELEEKEEIVFSGIVEKDGKKYRKYTKTSWRTSMNFKNRIVFDIDSHDAKNLETVRRFYIKLFETEFKTIKSLHGFHLISEKKYESNDWAYQLCRVLYPILKKEEYQKYRYELDRFYKNRKEERDKKELSRKELQDLTHDFEKKFRESGLFCGVGNFEILYAVNVIMRGFYSLRISKKNKNDMPELIQ